MFVMSQNSINVTGMFGWSVKQFAMKSFAILAILDDFNSLSNWFSCLIQSKSGTNPECREFVSVSTTEANIQTGWLFFVSLKKKKHLSVTKHKT